MENNLLIYHGSKHIIKKPTLYGGKETNDYGYGFYCTKEIELAKEWACPDGSDGYANEYLLNLKGLNILDLTNTKYNILNWIALLLKYRMPAGLSFNDEQIRQYIIENFSIDLSLLNKDRFKADLTEDKYVVGIRPEYFVTSDKPLFNAEIETVELIGKDCILNFKANGVNSKSIVDVNDNIREKDNVGFDIDYNGIYLFQENGVRVY